MSDRVETQRVVRPEPLSRPVVRQNLEPAATPPGVRKPRVSPGEHVARRRLDQSTPGPEPLGAAR